ncbi:zinc metalloprotease [Aquirhabdus parva]|uniref:LTD domain-containing protein n=1 Tax=Aquirhabdus parva TaxID=2283318 RepID=A0A345P9G8_9GAMM|nr:hypothetical protein [Aquirhabdus parva]AXI03927.1 hypothetical protein HYN46_14425 [Aquirhabdus parva]
MQQRITMQLGKVTPLMLAIMLVGCGEGGDSASAPSSMASSAAKQTTGTAVVKAAPAVVPAGLYISEVAGNFRKDKDYDAGTTNNSVAWVELYNNQNVAVRLQDYVLRTGGLKLNDPTSISQSVSFALPKVSIPAHGYVVLAGRKSPELKNTYVNENSKVVYILDSTKTYLPYWDNASGFIELQSVKTATVAAKTLDFVRFGSSTTSPLTAGAWSGANVPAFATPAANYVGSQSVDPLDTHDQSIVRLTSAFNVSKTKADWTLVNFPTSGGPNDVAAGVVDSDHDGIPDTAKVAGGTFAGLDLYTMGARPGRKDMFIQVDYLAANPATGTKESVIVPAEAALTKMVDAFTPHQIAVHFDAGTIYSANVDSAHYNLEGKSHERPFSSCTQVSVPSAGCNTLFSYYTQNVDPRRRAFFRYAMFASSIAADGSSSSSGISELPGNKVLVTLHGFLTDPLNANGQQMRTNFQAATLMHEVGHSLSLRHGGDELYVNYKPNYVSIMNYLYQLSGVPTSGTNSDAVERYYLQLNDYYGIVVPNTSNPGTTYNAYSYPYTALPHGPTTNTFKLDYSDGSSSNMDEGALNEGSYIGRGAGVGAAVFGDWNYDGVRQNAAYQYSITGQTDNFGNPIYAVLHDFNDWGHLALVTGKNYNLVGVAQSYGIGGYQPPLVKTSRVQTEDALPAHVLAHFKQLSSQ